MENMEKEALEPQKKFTTEEIEQLLINDEKAQCEIIASDIDVDRLPQELDESYFINKGYSPKEIQEIKERINNMINFLGSPIIKDSFNEDHNSRVEWRKIMDKKDEIYEYLQSNKTRVNRIISITIGLQNTERNAKKRGDNGLESKIQKILSGFPDTRNYKTKNYKELIIEEKIEFIHKVDDVIIQALQAFCK